MFIFAHVFAGALIGTGFFYLTRDRRFLPLCILGAILPDLLDKPLALLFPELLGSGRTIGHDLFFFLIVFAVGLLLWHYRHTLLAVAFAVAVFSHQILDAMWLSLRTWFYPVFGTFPGMLIPDYVGHYLWLELSCLSEWVFLGSSLIIIGLVYAGWTGRGWDKTARMAAALVLGLMGAYLLLSGLAALQGAFPAPTYPPDADIMAGLMALLGALVLFTWPGQSRFSIPGNPPTSRK
ncbi:MAG: metal-dependent hydrolase [Methanoregula sp.]